MGPLMGRIAPRAPARLNFAAAPPTTASPATLASTAARGRTAGFVSARRSWWSPPRGLPSTRVRRRARGRDGRKAALGAVRRSPVAGMEVTGRLTWLRRSCGRRAVGCRATTAANECEAACGGTQAVTTRGGGGSADAWAAEQRRGDRRHGNVRALGQADGSDARRCAEKQGRLRRRSGEQRHAEAAEQRRWCRAGSETQRGRGWATVQRASAEARQRVARRRWRCGGE